MKFFQFDPRPQGAEGNEKIFAAGPVFGVEVTIPALASRCVTNLDHHGPGDTAETPSACEQALALTELPDGEFNLATVRPDADSITAMAVVYLSCWDRHDEIDADLVRAVGEMDRLGPSALWANCPECGGVPPNAVGIAECGCGTYVPASLRDDRVVAIARVAADFKRTLEGRVEWVAQALAGKSDPSAMLNSRPRRPRAKCRSSRAGESRASPRRTDLQQTWGTRWPPWSSP